MKCPYCNRDFDPEEEEEIKVIISKVVYDKLMRFACIGEIALAKK